MIKIAGSIHRSFIFPANRPDAFEFYADLERTLSFLNHISLLRSYSDLQYRMLYNTTELGIYHVRLFCDIETELDRDARAIRIHPLEGKGIAPAGSNAGLYSSAAKGYYTSESLFAEEGDRTRVDYYLQIWATLPTPHGIRFMPNIVLNNIARTITQRRIHEIAEGFIERSVSAFLHVTNDRGEK
ncbi:MAG: hypothetical protein JXA78_12630 [Anaerolineales bacterium]|nr:hypothetical protein [Anaerolineales bacterium]